jgi:hypothetical protein
MGGWGDILFGVFMLVVRGRPDLATAFNFLGGGVMLVALVHYLECRKKD